MARFDPARPDFAPYGLTCVRWTPGVMRRPDRHNEIELNLLEAGSVTYLLGGRKVTVPSGRLAVFWAAIPHQVIDIATEQEYHVATLPLSWFLQCRLPDRLVRRILHAEVVVEPRPDRGGEDVALFERWRRDLQSRQPDHSRPMLLEAEARLLRLAGSLPAAARSRRVEQSALSKAEQMACYIALHYQEPLTIEQIAADAKLHPNYAMNLFRRALGTTLNDYVCQHRISHAQRLLATTDKQVVDICLDAGFGSVSRFNEAFKAACGCSPRAYRLRHRE
jgi:AraC family transcriptional regulator, melibiose operon regulatory protein